MSEQQPCCADAVARMVQKLTLPAGLQVGILNLDNIIKDVADLKLSDVETIKGELLKRVKTHSYVAPVAETDYSVALFQEYKRRLGEPK